MFALAVHARNNHRQSGGSGWAVRRVCRPAGLSCLVQLRCRCPAPFTRFCACFLFSFPTPSPSHNTRHRHACASPCNHNTNNCGPVRRCAVPRQPWGGSVRLWPGWKSSHSAAQVGGCVGAGARGCCSRPGPHPRRGRVPAAHDHRRVSSPERWVTWQGPHATSACEVVLPSCGLFPIPYLIHGLGIWGSCGTCRVLPPLGECSDHKLGLWMHAH